MSSRIRQGFKRTIKNTGKVVPVQAIKTAGNGGNSSTHS